VTDQTKDHKHTPGEVVARSTKFVSEYDLSYGEGWTTIVQYKCKE